MNKKLSCILVVLFLFLLFFGCIEPEENVNPYSDEDSSMNYTVPISKEEISCIENEDCSIVELHCCPLCDFFHPLNVIKEKANEIREWKKNNCNSDECFETHCGIPLVAKKAICSVGNCAIKRTPNCQIVCLEDKDLSELQSAAKELNITADELLKVCGC